MYMQSKFDLVEQDSETDSSVRRGVANGLKYNYTYYYT